MTHEQLYYAQCIQLFDGLYEIDDLKPRYIRTRLLDWYMVFIILNLTRILNHMLQVNKTSHDYALYICCPVSE